MSKKNQYVVSNGKDWAVKGAGNDKEINQKSEGQIRRPDGKLRDKDFYGNGPNAPKDKKH